MNKAKSCKLLIFILAFVLMISAAFALVPAFGGKAVSADEAASDVTVTEEDALKSFSGTAELKLAEDKLVASVKNSDTLIFDNQLVVGSGLSLRLSVPAEIKTLKLTARGDSKIATGNKNSEGEYLLDVKNELVLDFESGKATYNGVEHSFVSEGEFDIRFIEDGDFLAATFANVENAVAEDSYYAMSDDEKIAVSLSFTFTLKDGKESAEFGVISVSQEGRTQSFVKNGDGKIAVAVPSVTMGGDFLFREGADKINAYKGYRYSASLKAYSLLGGIASSDLYFALNDEADKKDILLANSAKPSKILFRNEGEYSFKVVYNGKNAAGENETVTVGTYTAKVIKEDTEAPRYIEIAGDNNPAIESFKASLSEAIMKDYDGNKTFVRLGDKITVPSMKSLVTDDNTAYANLKHTLYYKTPSSDTKSTTGWDITLTETGKYVFWVIFEDVGGNKMTEDQFFKIDEEDSNNVIINEEVYGAFLFDFVIGKNDAPVYVTAASQGTGYKGVKYTATAFKFESTDHKAEYTLYYNAKADATIPDTLKWEENGWVAIPKASTVKEGGTMPNGFTYDEVKSIGYDGSLTFTPDRTGTYAIECHITSNTSASRDESAAALIRVKEKTATVTPYSKTFAAWVKNNVWSVVFLSIGTLCLIAIIVLLCIKPKDEPVKASDEEIKRK